MQRFFRPEGYVRPTKVSEACSLLSRYGKRAKVLAGGTDLLVEKDPATRYLIDITRLDLRYIRANKKTLKIGPLSTINDIECSDVIKNGSCKILSETAVMFADPTIRNTATIGGNICSAIPSADFPPILIALDAKVRIRGLNGERVLSLEEFFLAPRRNALKKSELLTEILVPEQPSSSHAVFLKKTRTRRDIALVNVAVRVRVGADGACKDIRIVLGAVAPTPIRTKKAESMLRGKKIENGLIRKVSHKASEETRPISDVRASLEYRKDLSEVLVRRALETAFDEVGT